MEYIKDLAIKDKRIKLSTIIIWLMLNTKANFFIYLLLEHYLKG